MPRLYTDSQLPTNYQTLITFKHLNKKYFKVRRGSSFERATYLFEISDRKTSIFIYYNACLLHVFTISSYIPFQLQRLDWTRLSIKSQLTLTESSTHPMLLIICLTICSWKTAFTHTTTKRHSTAVVVLIEPLEHMTEVTIKGMQSTEPTKSTSTLIARLY